MVENDIIMNMKKIIPSFFAGILYVIPTLVSAQAFDPNGGDLEDSADNTLEFFNDVLIPFFLGLGFLFVVWGVFRYFIAGAANEESRQKGKTLVVYAIIAYVFLVAFWGIVNIFSDGTNLSGQNLENRPTVLP